DVARRGRAAAAGVGRGAGPRRRGSDAAGRGGSLRTTGGPARRCRTVGGGHDRLDRPAAGARPESVHGTTGGPRGGALAARPSAVAAGLVRVAMLRRCVAAGSDSHARADEIVAQLFL